MGMEKRLNAWLPWASVALLAVLCGVLAVLQYRWTGEISEAERQRLEEDLRDRLDRLQRELNGDLASSARALQPPASLVEQLGSEGAYAEQFVRWKSVHEPIFRRIAIAVPCGEDVQLYSLDFGRARFSAAAWPDEWSATRSRLQHRLGGEPAGPAESALLEIPRPGEDGREPEWLLLEPDLDYFRAHELPDLVARDLGDSGRLEYDAAVVAQADPSTIIYESSAGAAQRTVQVADASVSLLNLRFPAGPPGEPGARFAGGPPPPRNFGRGFGRPSRPPEMPALWLLRVRHQTGSLEALVAQARRRNLAVSGGLLLLILATVTMLVRLSRKAQQLADLQIHFVAGVSHELRTPLAVIRTAAYNLRGQLAHRPEQVEEYGELIQGACQRLGGLVEQILRFAGAQAGQIIRHREPVDLKTLIERSLASAQPAAGNSNLVFETHIQPGLPPVFADPEALHHAFQNLIENAMKHGAAREAWIGVSARAVDDAAGLAVEISVTDRGPGIPAEEQKQIFEPFFRGRRAVADQVHGTGLGLDLVRRIVEAHGGTIRVQSAPGAGAAFIVRLRAMAPEKQDELAHSLG